MPERGTAVPPATRTPPAGRDAEAPAARRQPGTGFSDPPAVDQCRYAPPRSIEQHVRATALLRPEILQAVPEPGRRGATGAGLRGDRSSKADPRVGTPAAATHSPPPPGARRDRAPGVAPFELARWEAFGVDRTDDGVPPHAPASSGDPGHHRRRIHDTSTTARTPPPTPTYSSSRPSTAHQRERPRGPSAPSCGTWCGRPSKRGRGS